MASQYDPTNARVYLIESLLISRVELPSPEQFRLAFEVALHIANSGNTIPPLGLLMDLRQVLLDYPNVRPRTRTDSDEHLFDADLIRFYEDYVLGKFLVDRSMERASDAICHYALEDQPKGVAFVAERVLDRCHFIGLNCNPALLRSLSLEQPENLLAEARDQITKHGVQATLDEHFRKLIHAIRQFGDVLGNEDLFELEHGTALSQFGERVALRQLLRAADLLTAELPDYVLRPWPGRREVPTHMVDEDTYPVGGFSSLSTKGSIESLLHSQLAYMDKEDRPDLFDIKFVRDELLYYSRDENQFLRRRRTFVFVITPEVKNFSFKLKDLPFQHIILLLGLLLALVRRLSDWLSVDALRFEFCFLADESVFPLRPERELLKIALRELIDNGIVELNEQLYVHAMAKHFQQLSRQSQCHVLWIGETIPDLDFGQVVLTNLRLERSLPYVLQEQHSLNQPSESTFGGWIDALKIILQLWV